MLRIFAMNQAQEKRQADDAKDTDIQKRLCRDLSAAWKGLSASGTHLRALLTHEELALVAHNLARGWDAYTHGAAGWSNPRGREERARLFAARPS